MVVLPKVTPCFFFTFVRLAVTARARSSLHQVLSSSLSAAASLFVPRWDFCSLCSPKEKNPDLPHSCSIHVPNLCNTFLPSMRDASCKPHTLQGGESGFTTKNWRSKTSLKGREKGLKAEKVRAQRRRAAPCHPSCRGASSSFPRGLCACVLKLRYGSCRPSTVL